METEKRLKESGSVAVLYQNYGNDDGGDGGENAEAEDSREQAAAFEGYGVWLISAQGDEKRIALPIDEEERVNCLCFSEDGSRLFAASLDQKIYEIDREAETARLFLTADIMPDVFCAWEHYMALKNEQEGVVLYDLDKAEKIEDNVITDFVKKNCSVKEKISESTYSIFPAEEKGIYLVCNKGVYRHVIGGTVMEQVINGGLCSLSDPMKHVVKMTRTAGEGFLAAFLEKTLSAFNYDPNISTVPLQTFTAYSLTENDILRQTISRYQGEHPDVYVEKGILADLTPYLAELEKEEKILPNIIESFTADGKTYMIPAAITISMYLTDKENMTNVSDLSSLADMIEKLRSEFPGEGIMETYSEDMILNALMPVSAPLWVKEAGELNEEEISDYLKQTKRIYDACMEGLNEEVLQRYLDLEQNGVNSSSEISAYNDLQGGGIQIAAGNEKVTLGELKNAYNYAFLQSINKQDNGENGRNCRASLTPGSVKDAFCPYALMGVNAASDQAELAGDFLCEALSEKIQRMIYPTGFPVNEAGLQIYLETLGGQVDWAKPGEDYGNFCFINDGMTLLITTYMPTEQETEELYELLSGVRTPYLADAVVEDVVREVGKWYLEGRCSLEEALGEIQEKLAIYMAE